MQAILIRFLTKFPADGRSGFENARFAAINSFNGGKIVLQKRLSNCRTHHSNLFAAEKMLTVFQKHLPNARRTSRHSIQTANRSKQLFCRWPQRTACSPGNPPLLLFSCWLDLPFAPAEERTPAAELQRNDFIMLHATLPAILILALSSPST